MSIDVTTPDLATIEFEVADDHVATITLDRPDALNAVNDRMAAEIEWAWRTIRDDDSIHAVVLQANGDLNTALLFAALVVLSTIGLLLYGLVSLIEKLAIPWHVSQRAWGGEGTL